MNWVLNLYPREFRERYGDEVAEMLASSPTPRRDLLNIVWNALLERTEYAVRLGWRRAPRYSVYFVLWLAAAYVFSYVQARLASMIIKFFVVESGSIPVLRPDVEWMRAATALCVALLAFAAFFLGRRYWRGTAETVVVALALTGVVVSVLRIDAFGAYGIEVSWHWELIGYMLAEAAVWIAGAAFLVWGLRRVRRPGLVAVVGVVAVAYAKSVIMTALLDLMFTLPGNPWADYWQSIMGGVLVVITDDNVGIGVQIGGWSATIAAAFLAGCTLAARRVPKTAQSAELAS
jgi:hypothetical protein